ncbi:MAG: DUF4340 domain-containing protein [Bacteroidota bacterium]
MNWNNKILAIIFFVLLGIWILNKSFNRVSDTSFKSVLMQVDTATVDKLVLYPKGMDSTVLTLTRSNGNWNISNSTLTTAADKNRVTSVLSQIAYIPTKRLISKKEENQVDYEVDDKNGKIVEVYQGDNLLNKVIFGRFNFNQNTRSATSYGRIADDNEIYSLDGMISMSFDTDFNSFRNNKLISINKDDIRGIEYNGTPLQPAGKNLWTYNGIQVDSIGMTSYLRGLSNITSTTFADGFSGNSGSSKTMTIRVDNMAAPLTIQAYNSANGFIIKSSENEAFFGSDSTGVYKKIFGDLDALISGG